MVRLTYNLDVFMYIFLTGMITEHILAPTGHSESPFVSFLLKYFTLFSCGLLYLWSALKNSGNTRNL